MATWVCGYFKDNRAITGRDECNALNIGLAREYLGCSDCVISEDGDCEGPEDDDEHR